jgi:nitroreductase
MKARSPLSLKSLLRRLLSPAWSRARDKVFRLGGRSEKWARLYYLLFDGAFGREQSSVLAGRAAYEESLGVCGTTAVLVRRNVHRLEKGILMRPRRVPFARDYIGETVDAYARAVVSADWAAEEKRWATDVLAEYFAIHAGSGAVADERARFEAARGPAVPIAATDETYVPYLRNLAEPIGISVAQLRALAQHRRSVRWFRKEPVERSVIDAALEIGLQAPSACNRQPFQFRIFDREDLVRKIVALPFGTVGYGENIPVVAVVVGQQRNFFSDRDRHLIYIDASLAVMGFLYGLEVQGVSSCCINWPDVADRESSMARLLGLEPDERPVMLIAIGYPDTEGMVAASAKKSLDVLRSYNDVGAADSGAPRA